MLRHRTNIPLLRFFFFSDFELTIKRILKNIRRCFRFHGKWKVYDLSARWRQRPSKQSCGHFAEGVKQNFAAQIYKWPYSIHCLKEMGYTTCHCNFFFKSTFYIRILTLHTGKCLPRWVQFNFKTIFYHRNTNDNTIETEQYKGKVTLFLYPNVIFKISWKFYHEINNSCIQMKMCNSFPVAIIHVYCNRI